MQVKKVTSELKFILPALLISAVSYIRMLGGFFQQDEWIGYARYILLRGSSLIDVLKYAFSPSLSHYTPFGKLTLYFAFGLFRLDYIAFSVLSISLHLIVVVSVYFLAKLLFGNRLFSFMCALLFGVFAAGYQGTTWVAADIGGHLASLFGILSITMFVWFVTKKETKFIFLSSLFLVISLFFKEITVGLFLLYFLFIIFSYKKRQLTGRKYLVFFGFAIFYFLLRGSMFLMPTSELVNVDVATQTQSNSYLYYNLLTFPIKGVSQTLIPAVELAKVESIIANRFMHLNEIWLWEFGTFSIFFLFTLLVYKRIKGNNWKFRWLLFYSYFFILVNSLVYALSPGRQGVVIDIDSRNLYFPAVGMVFVLACLALKFGQGNFPKASGILVPIILINFFWLSSQVTELVKVGQLRKQILTQIITEHPDLPDKVVFYAESDSTDYGLPPNERIFPFQSGLGQTLLSWYWAKEQFQKEFFEDKFLWELKEQGYRGVDEMGFGYFRDFGLLAKTMDENGLSLESLIGYRYDVETTSITDNTFEIIGRVEGYRALKREVDSSLLNVSASHNSSKTKLAIDGVRKTAWDSNIPYSISQNFEVELKEPARIAQIGIDAYNNSDQNAVGYQVLLSEDAQKWHEVFFAERYNPWEEKVVVNLYFKPQIAKYIRINQVGYHNQASWVIHELKLYEVY